MAESQTTKTVVVDNDIHKAIRVYAEESDDNIQDVVDAMLRGNEDVRRNVMATYDRLEKQHNLPTT